MPLSGSVNSTPVTMALCLHRFTIATACRPAQSSKGRRWWKRRPRQLWCGPGNRPASTVSVSCQSKSADEVRWPALKARAAVVTHSLNLKR